MSCQSFVVGMGVCRRGRQTLPRGVRSGWERRLLAGATDNRIASKTRRLQEPGRLDGTAAAGAWATDAGGVIMAPSNVGDVIIGGRGPAASARDEGEEGGVADASAAARPLF